MIFKTVSLYEKLAFYFILIPINQLVSRPFTGRAAMCVESVSPDSILKSFFTVNFVHKISLKKGKVCITCSYLILLAESRFIVILDAESNAFMNLDLKTV